MPTEKIDNTIEKLDMENMCSKLTSYWQLLAADPCKLSQLLINFKSLGSILSQKRDYH